MDTVDGLKFRTGGSPDHRNACDQIPTAVKLFCGCGSALLDSPLHSYLYFKLGLMYFLPLFTHLHT